MSRSVLRISVSGHRRHTRDQLARAVFERNDNWYNPRRHSYNDGLSLMDHETKNAAGSPISQPFVGPGGPPHVPTPTTLAAGPDRRPHRLDPRSLLLLGVAVFVVHVASPSVQVTDSRLSVPVATQVLRHRTLDLTGSPSVKNLRHLDDTRRRDGKVLPFFPWPPMLLAIPGALIVNLTGHDPALLKPSDPNQTWFVEVPTASALVALTAVLIALLAFESLPENLGHRQRYAIASGLVFAFATAAWSTGSRALWQHTPSLLCLTVVLYLAPKIEQSRRPAVMFGAALGAAYVVRPTNAVVVAAFLLWVFVARRRYMLGIGAGLGAVLLPFVLVNLISYGAVLPPYYAAERVVAEAALPFSQTAAMYLVSPSRGLLIYCPLIFTAIAGTMLLVKRGGFTALHATAWVVIGAYLLVVSLFGGTGGSSYGPRLLTDISPFVVWLSLPVLGIFDGTVHDRGSRLWHRAGCSAVCVILAWGVLVNASGATLRSAFCWSATPEVVTEAPSRVWDWKDPQFFRPVKVLRETGSLHQVVLQSCGAGPAPG